MGDVIISKYGGSSITSHTDIERIKRITYDNPRRKIIVVSAPGKRDNDDVKVTDMLIQLARTKDSDLFDRILNRYKIVFPDENLEDITAMLDRRLNQNLEGKNDADRESPYKDGIAAFGEEACARLLAKYLGAEYVDSRELFMVTNDFGNAIILPCSEKMITKRLNKTNSLYVVPGFYGCTENGLTAIFGRNKSDLTGAYVAYSLDAMLYEIFSDKEGVLASDPDIVKDPVKIDKITFEEMRDLAYSGFNIFHPEAMGPVAKKKIPVHIRETAKYPAEGTYVVHERVSDLNKPIVGIAYQNGFCAFNIWAFGLNDRVGIAYDILGIFKERNISMEFMPGVIDDISVVLKRNQLKNHSIENIIAEIHSLNDEGIEINFQDNLGCIVVAGICLKNRNVSSANIQRTIESSGVDIEFISRGSKKRCIVYGVNHSDGRKAVNAVYNKYIRSKTHV